MSQEIQSPQPAPGLYSGRYFPSAEAAAMHFQHLARLRSANSREFGRYGPMRCAWMQREAASLYAAARDAITTGPQQ